jgi:Tol biopolymer transport system component
MVCGSIARSFPWSGCLLRACRLVLAIGCAVVGAGPVVAQSPPKNSETIVFSSDRGGPWRLWSVSADGTNLRPLTHGGPEDNDVDPVFTRDGRQILFSSTRGGTTGVWRAAADGTAAQRICDGDQAEWSPDARRIVFRLGGRLFVRELASGRQVPITPADWPHCSGPAWSPDGKRIAFACRWDAGNALFLTTPDGALPVKLYDRQGACEPHWSPDARRIVYETETQICTIQPDGKKNRVLTFFGGVQRYGRFSPDGRWIVFCQGSSERGPWELYRIPAAGGAPVKITEGGSDMFPDWK